MPDDAPPGAPLPPGDADQTRIQPIPGASEYPSALPDDQPTRIESIARDEDQDASSARTTSPEEERTIVQRLDTPSPPPPPVEAGGAGDESTDRHVPRPASMLPTADDTTPGGYSFTVVPGDEIAARPAKGSSGRARGVLALLAAAIVPAVIVGGLVWFFAPGRDGDDERVTRDVTNVVNAFSSGQDGTVNTRFGGQLPPGFPADLPVYPGARVLSALLQISDQDAGYLVIYDTDDPRADVAAFYAEQFSADPWQVDAGQDGRDTTLQQFSKIDDPDITGLVLVAESKDDSLTTIVASVQVIAGADEIDEQPFTEPAARPLPSDFPEGIPAYDGALLIESTFQKEAGASNFAVSFITRDDPSDVLDFYRERLEAGDLTVEDGDSENSSLEDAQAVRFSDQALELTGEIAVGEFAEDGAYTRIDVQVSDQRSSND